MGVAAAKWIRILALCLGVCGRIEATQPRPTPDPPPGAGRAAGRNTMTPTGTAPGTPTGTRALSTADSYNPFTGWVAAAVPLHHIGGRGGGFDLVWNVQQPWVAVKQIGGATPQTIVQQYPTGSATQNPTVTPLGGAGAVYSRTGATMASCGTATYNSVATTTTIVYVTGNGTEINLARDPVSEYRWKHAAIRSELSGVGPESDRKHAWKRGSQRHSVFSGWDVLRD